MTTARSSKTGAHVSTGHDDAHLSKERAHAPAALSSILSFNFYVTSPGAWPGRAGETVDRSDRKACDYSPA